VLRALMEDVTDIEESKPLVCRRRQLNVEMAQEVIA
jgi:succinyl-CoA synthetase beta subunit